MALPALVATLVLGACGPREAGSSACTPANGPFWTNGSVIDLEACGIPSPYSPEGCNPSTCTFDASCQNCYYAAQGCERDCFRQPYNTLMDNLPTEHRSEAGVLEVELHVDACYHLQPLPVVYEGCSSPSSKERGLGTVGTWGWCINGMIPGPTLIVKPGDRLVINLVNDLGAEMAQADWAFNQPGRFNSTNLHVHGLYVSPLPSSDHVLVHVGPGESYTYVYDIPPWHPTGSFWYHPHRHNSADTQVAIGMHGFILVEEPAEGGVLSTMPTVPLIYTQLLNHFIDGSGQTTAAQLEANGIDPSTAFNPALICGNGNPSFPEQGAAPGLRQSFYCENYTASAVGYTLTTGMALPKIQMVSGKWYRLRMLNTGNGEVQVVWGLGGVYPSELGCEAWVVARDGITLKRPRNIEEYYLSRERPYSFFNVLMSGARYDYAVRCERSALNSRGIKVVVVRGQQDLRTPGAAPADPVPGMTAYTDPVAYIDVLPPIQGVVQRCRANHAADRPAGMRRRSGHRPPPWSECALLRAQPRFNMRPTTHLGPDLGWRFAPTKDDPISGRFTANFTSVATPYTSAWGYQPMRPQPTPPPGATNFSFTFNINGLSFSTTHVMHRAALGTTEEWTVQSTDWVALHIFHVHTWHFQIMDYQLTSTYPWINTQDALPVDLDDFWFDVVGLATQDLSDCTSGLSTDCEGYRRAFDLAGPGGAALIRLRFFEFSGELIFHCHVLTHEDAGMMAYTTVGEGAAPPAHALESVPNLFSYSWRKGPCKDVLPRQECMRHSRERRCWQRRVANTCARTCALCTDAPWRTRDRKGAFYLSDTNEPSGPGGSAAGRVTASGSEPGGATYTIFLTSPSQLLMAPGTTEYEDTVLNPPLSSANPWGSQWSLASFLRASANAEELGAEARGARGAVWAAAALVALGGALAAGVGVARRRQLQARRAAERDFGLARGGTTRRLHVVGTAGMDATDGELADGSEEARPVLL